MNSHGRGKGTRSEDYGKKKVRKILDTTLALVLLSVVAFATLASGEKAIVPPDQDAYISTESKNTNYGTTTLLETSGGYSTDDTTRALLRFNVGFLPVDAVVQVAYLYIYDQTGEDAYEADVHGVTESWTEGGVTWSNQPALPSL